MSSEDIKADESIPESFISAWIRSTNESDELDSDMMKMIEKYTDNDVLDVPSLQTALETINED